MTKWRSQGRSHRRDPEASRAAILEAARQVFTERGYARATIREIARRAGVTHGLVMRHFGTKEQLLIAALPGPRVAAGGVLAELTQQELVGYLVPAIRALLAPAIAAAERDG